MKVLWRKGTVKYWTLLLVFLCGGVWLAGGAEPLNVYQRIDVSRAGQSVKVDFDVSEKGDYQFALLFNLAYKMYPGDKLPQGNVLFGNANESGEIIPVTLRLIKDGKLFLDEKIESKGTVRRHEFYFEEGRIHTVVRNIKTMELPAGHYSATITILKEVPAFDDIGSFVQIVYFTPENLVRIDEHTQAMDRRTERDWYKNWRFVTWLARGIYCLAFCPEQVSIYTPLDVSSAGKSVRVDFDVPEKRAYEFSLMFDKGDDYEEMDRRFKLFGSVDDRGVVIPISLYLVKDGEVFYDRTINTEGNSWEQDFYFGERRVNSAGRIIKILELPPGHYSLVMSTQKDTPEFNRIETFVKID